MYDTLNLEHIQAPPYGPEAQKTRFDPEFQDSARLYVPEQRSEQAMFTYNPKLEVEATAQKAVELATPAGDTFIVPQTPQEIAANQRAYVEVITAEAPSNVVGFEARQYANTQEAISEALRAGASLENVRNAA